MYQVHDWAKARELAREGIPRQRIAERLGCSRTTVYRLLALETPPRYERRAAGSLLDPFKDAVAALLADDPAAPATVIREHLQGAGYGGGITILKDYLAAVRPQFKAARDYQRTTYAPGELLQADWWDTGVDLPVGKGASRRVHGFVATLPFSAAHAVVYTHSQTTADALPALLGCLARLGGVPAKLVIDRDSSLALCRRGARPRPVDELAALLGALSMGHIVLPAYSPQSKGGVERTNGYLKTSFLPLRRFSGLADLQAQSDAWTAEVAWPRHLRRLGAKVVEALAVERAELAELPDPLPEVDRRLEVRASRDGFARVAGVDYSLPPGYGQRRLAVHLSLHDLRIFCEGRQHRRPRAQLRTLRRGPRPRAHGRTGRGADCPAPPPGRRARAARGRPRPLRRPARGAAVSGDAASEVAFLARALKAPRLRERAGALAERAREGSWSYEEYLAAVLGEEVAARESHGGQARVQAARFPAVKTLDDFDFAFARGVKRETVLHLHQLDFLAEHMNVIFLGPPGTGKTHLSIALGVQAARRGHRVAFASAQQWVARLAQAKRQGRLDEELERIGRLPLIVVDEVGYIPFDPEAAALFFALVSSRYERSSIIVSSNKTFSAWAEIFGDPVAVAALVDRLVHHAEVLVLRGDSYRLKGKGKEVLQGDARG